MITKLEVLNLPYQSETLRWERGDTIALPTQSLLFIGGNGSGKSTMLGSIYKSLVNNALFTNGGSHLPKVTNPYLTFTEAFEGDSWKIQIYEHEDAEAYHSKANKKNQEAEFIEALDGAIQAIFKNGLNYIWDVRYRATKGQFEQVLIRYKEKVEMESPVGELPNNIFGIGSEGFHEAIGLYARKYKIDREVIYGTFVLIFGGTYPYLDNDVTRFGYIKLTGKGLVETPVITGFAPEEKRQKESMGERSKRLIDSIQPDCMVILDEPTEGISLSDKRGYTEKLGLASETSQILASTHEGLVLALAEAHPKWSIYDLDQKKLLKKPR